MNNIALYYNMCYYNSKIKNKEGKMSMLLDKIGIINTKTSSKKENSTNNVDSSLTMNVPDKNVNKDNENIFNNISIINKINNTIEFLINMNNSKLLYELYSLMENQIQIYDENKTYRVLELTQEQLNIFKKNNIEMEIFKKEPFCIDSIIVYEKRNIEYKFFGSQSEIERINLEYNKEFKRDEGLYFLTSNVKGYLGKGLYVCDIKDESSDILFNNLISDKLHVLSRNSNEYIHFLEGEYNGLIKKCILGNLEGMYVLVNPLSKRPAKNKEELCLYGDIEDEESNVISKDEEVNLILQKNLPDLTISLSSVSCEIEEDAMG